MIKTKHVFVKPKKVSSSKTKIDKGQVENVKPICFNTKGYFDPQIPYDENYLKAKAQAFKKYRNTQEQYVMLDSNLAKKRMSLIQKTIAISIGDYHKMSIQDQLPPLTERRQSARNSLLKTYMQRKGRFDQIDQLKYNEVQNYAKVQRISTEFLHRKIASSASLNRQKAYSRNTNRGSQL